MPSSHADLPGFMNGERIASFVTVDSEGKPHVVPVFFTFDLDRVYAQTDRDPKKVRNLKGNNGVAAAVYSGEEAVIIRGKGRIIEDPKEFARRTREHVEKYHLKLNRRGRDSLGIPLFDGRVRCVIEVVPERLLFW